MGCRDVKAQKSASQCASHECEKWETGICSWIYWSVWGRGGGFFLFWQFVLFYFLLIYLFLISPRFILLFIDLFVCF